MSSRAKYLLSTAPVPQELIGKAAAGNMVLDVKAFIAVEQLPVEGVETLAVQQLIAVFTSVNAVEAVLREAGAPRGWKIYCTEGVTSKRIEAAFGEASVAGKADSAEKLAGLIAGQEKTTNASRAQAAQVFFFCGDQRRDELPAILTRAGFKVVERLAYRTVPTPQRLDREYAGIAFFSPSGVESYFSRNAAGERTVMFAIGQTTASAIRGRCGNPIVSGDRPDKAALIEKMIEYFKNEQC